MWLILHMGRRWSLKALASRKPIRTKPEVVNPLLLFRNDGHIRPLSEIEDDLLRLALVKNGGCVSKAAAELHIGRSTFYRRLSLSGAHSGGDVGAFPRFHAEKRRG